MYQAITSKEDKSLLDKWFWCDNNCVPPMYILQPVTHYLPDYNNYSVSSDRRKEAKKEWWKAFELMQVVLREAASKAFNDEIITRKYFISGK